MKKTILTIALSSAFLFSSAFVLSSCGNSESAEETHEHMEGDEHGDKNHEEMATEQMAEAKFACPMHPEITGVDGDKCSICNMDLKEVDKTE